MGTGRNGTYGDRAALEAYSGIRVASTDHLPHGLAHWKRLHPWEYNQCAGKRILCWQPHLDKVYEAAGLRVVPIAAPFFYACSLVEPEPTGTLCVPDHSTKATTLDCDWERLAEDWSAYPNPTLLAFFYDLERGHYKPFERRGFRIISCGNAEDPNYMLNLARYMKGADLIVSNQASTNAAYGVLLGKPYLITHDRPESVAQNREPAWEYTDHLERLYDTLADGKPDITDAKCAVCADVCRSELMPPYKLARLLQ